jgi:hypothetical protein
MGVPTKTDAEDDHISIFQPCIRDTNTVFMNIFITPPVMR